MAEGFIIVKDKTIKSLEDKLLPLNIVSEEFENFFNSARNFGLDAITKCGKDINANIFAIEEDYPLSDNSHYIKGTFYKLNE